MLVVFAFATIAMLAVIGVLYSFGLVLAQRRGLQTAADAASLSGSWKLLQDQRVNPPADSQVLSAVVQFAIANGWSADGRQLDDAHLCPQSPAGALLCAYYLNASGSLCTGAPAALVHVGNLAGNLPADARGVQVTLSRDVPTLLLGFVNNEVLQTRVQASAAATAGSTRTPVLIAEAVGC